MAERRRDAISPQVAAGLAWAIAAWVLWDRYTFLTASDLPTGIDGHYYAVQLRSLIADGHLYYPDAPLALWLMAPLAWLLGPVTGLAAGASLASAAIVMAGYVLACRLTHSRGAALVAAAILASSAGAFYLPTEFVKNTFGLVFGLAFLAQLCAALDRPDRWRIALCALWFTLTALCHPLVTMIAIGLAVAPIATAAWTRGRRALAGAVVCGAASVAASVAWVRGDVVSGFAGPTDLTMAALRVGDRALHFRGEPIAAALFALALIILLVRAHRSSDALSGPRQAMAGAIAGWALLTAWPWLSIDDPQGPGFRLRILAFVPLALCLATAAALVTRRLGARKQTIAIMLAIGFALYRPSRYTEPVVRADPAVARALADSRGLVASNQVVISPERQLVFMNMWHTEVETRLRPEPRDTRSSWRLVPLSYLRGSVLAALDQIRASDSHPIYSLHPAHPYRLVLMPESTWQAVLAGLPDADRRHYQAWPIY